MSEPLIAGGTAAQWEALRAPFDPKEIEKLPRYTGPKGPDGKPPRDSWRTCKECGGYHPLPAVHLDYVGHAGITMRLNAVDPTWQMEPLATDGNGLPLVVDGVLWVRLTVLGVTHLGVGDADGKSHGGDKDGKKQWTNIYKLLLGDALRNAARWFGVGTYLWSKSESAHALRGDEPPQDNGDKDGQATQPATRTYTIGAETGNVVKLGELKGKSYADVPRQELHKLASWYDKQSLLPEKAKYLAANIAERDSINSWLASTKTSDELPTVDVRADVPTITEEEMDREVGEWRDAFANTAEASDFDEHLGNLNKIENSVVQRKAKRALAARVKELGLEWSEKTESFVKGQS